MIHRQALTGFLPPRDKNIASYQGSKGLKPLVFCVLREAAAFGSVNVGSPFHGRPATPGVASRFRGEDRRRSLVYPRERTHPRAATFMRRGVETPLYPLTLTRGRLHLPRGARGRRIMNDVRAVRRWRRWHRFLHNEARRTGWMFICAKTVPPPVLGQRDPCVQFLHGGEMRTPLFVIFACNLIFIGCTQVTEPEAFPPSRPAT